VTAQAIREAKRQDCAAVSALWLEMMDLHGAIDGRFRFEPGALREFERHFQATIRCRESRLLVAESDGRIVGYILGELHSRKPIYPAGRYGFISDLSVTADYRRQGIGRALALAVLDWFRLHRVTAVELFAAEANPVSLAFWRSLGFHDFLRMMRHELE
jgi:ribosomal protein S18 acetylase RimI-like enzyme